MATLNNLSHEEIEELFMNSLENFFSGELTAKERSILEWMKSGGKGRFWDLPENKE